LPNGRRSLASVRSLHPLNISSYSYFGTADGRDSHPTSTQEALQQLIANFENTAQGSDGGDHVDPEDPPLVVEAKSRPIEATEFTYTEKDVILYNLGVGATEKELHWVFESDDHFQAIPTFGVIPQFAASSILPFDWVPNFNPVCYIYKPERFYTNLAKGQTSSRRAVLGYQGPHPYQRDIDQ
jgi:hypothetical protein